jgi:chemotaxis protein CheD
MNRPEQVTEIFLRPGEIHFGHAGTSIRTILGSCVALVFWHPQKRIGGMCHYMLPGRRGRVANKLDGRYADEALELLLREVSKSGTRSQEYRVQLFGGGNMFPSIATKDRGEVGKRNVDAARILIEKHGLRPVSEHVGGIGHRHLVFDIWNGDVRLKHVRMLSVAPMSLEEGPLCRQ